MSRNFPFEIITLELEELDGKHEVGRPKSIISNAANILLIDDLLPSGETGDYEDLWEKFLSKNVFDTIGQKLNLFWIRSIHAACLKLIENHQAILPEANFTPENTIIFLDMDFEKTEEHGWLIASKRPKFESYLKNKGIEFDYTPGMRNGGGILHGGTEGGEIFLKSLDKSEQNNFLIFPWTSDPGNTDADNRYEPFRTNFKRLLLPLSKETIWAAGRDNCKHLKEALEILENPLAEVKLSNVSKSDLETAYKTLFFGNLHNPSEILKSDGINEWKKRFSKFFDIKINVSGKEGKWSQIGDKELQRIFGKIKKELDKNEVSSTFRIGLIKLKLMFLRNENQKVSILDLFESLVLESSEKEDLCICYYGQSLNKQQIIKELEQVGFSCTLWKEIENNNFDVAEITKEFNFYEIKEALQTKIRENISRMNATNVQIYFYFEASDDAAADNATECRIAIKDNVAEPYTKRFSVSHQGQESEFLRFVKDKLNTDSLPVLIIRDVFSKPIKDSESLVNRIKNCLPNQSYILTVKGLYTEVVLRIV